MTEIIAIGLNHKTAPIEVREAIALSDKQKKRLMSDIIELPHCKGVVILNTCNRCEIYTCTEKPEDAIRQIQDRLDSHSDMQEELEEHIYFHEGENGILHLFRVASGLDSMVKGEPQILGQVKEAYEFSCEEGCCNTTMHEIFKRGIRAGKRARDETSISEKAVSIGTAACELAEQELDSLREADVLVVGAGDMGKVVLRNLISRGVSDPVISNRTFERSLYLADEFEGEAIQQDEIEDHLEEYDLIISSTGSSEPIITWDMCGGRLDSSNKKHLFIDLAVPRDIEPSVNDIEGIQVYDIDDLDEVIKENLPEGMSDLEKIGDIIEREFESLKRWMKHRKAAPLIEALNEKAEEIRSKEVEKALNKLITAEDKEEKKRVMEDFSRSLVQKLLHDPIVNSKRFVENEEEQKKDEFELICDLFDIEV